ncbi:FAS1 domain-containing protein [Calycina marina]|uniref:FAS1 domain-containing protein n=1 Tax=Calycina marina TaxID=1763456 RepID=A0A9P7ZB05_9HELO|nr:FAS1 domain-containing protein [Calycina marina]
MEMMADCIFQILAPSDDAFNKIPYTSLNEAFQNNDETVITNILEYHILQGQRMAADLIPGTPVFIATLLTDPSYTNVTGGQMVGNVKQAGDVVVLTSGQGSRSTVVIKDLSFTGGVVQVIDSLLVPPTGFPETAQAFNFTSYEGATYATNKTDNITYTKDLTLLVPQNQAFLALGPAISSMTSDQLAQVVDYSIIPELLYSTSLTNGSHFKTLQGGNITILHVGNNMYINSAQVLTTDILIANGVIHVIDNVLNPQGPGAQPNPVIPSQAPVFASASQVNSIPFTSALPCTTNCPITSTSAASASGTAGVSGASGAGATSTTSVSTRTSSGRAAAMAQETGLRAAGLMAAIGGAVFMI